MRLHRPSVLRGCAALLVAGGALAAVAVPSQAAGLTDPLAPVTQPLTGALSSLPVPLPSAPLPSAPLPTAPSLPLPTGASTGGSATSSAGTSTGGSGTSAAGARSTTAPRGQAPRSGSTAAAAPAAGRGSAASARSGSPAGVAADTPVATLCLFATGGSSPAFEVDAKALGADLSSPLVERFPQVFAPCPAGAVPAGDHVAAVDAAVQGLLGACVRVTREVAPLQTTLVVLDRDLIRELTAAGLPLQQLVVPCPGGSPSLSGSSSTAAPTGGSAFTQADQVTALSSLGRLAFTGSDAVPTVLAGVGMLVLGVLLARARTLVPVRRRH